MSVVYLNVQIEEPRSDHSSSLSYQTISLVFQMIAVHNSVQRKGIFSSCTVDP